MKYRPDDLKVASDQLTPGLGTNSAAHLSSASHRKTHHHNRKASQQRSEKKPFEPPRIRKITTSFAFIGHRFVHDGFWCRLDHHPLLLDLFYEYIFARDLPIEKDPVAFDACLFQLLSLPEKPRSCPPAALKTVKTMQTYHRATAHQLITHCFGKKT